MFELNEIICNNVKGADSEMPLPIHHFHAASLELGAPRGGGLSNPLE